MTYSAVPAIRRQPSSRREWEPRLSRVAYDPRFRPAPDKTGALFGMGMTEKQGGSDVRANTTPRLAAERRRRRAEYLAHRTQVVLLGPDVRRLPRARAGAAGLSCFLLAALHARRHAQPHRFSAPQRQARQSLERLTEVEFDGALRPGWSASRGPRRADDHRDGRATRGSIASSGPRRSCGRRSSQALHHAAHRRGRSARSSSTSR